VSRSGQIAQMAVPMKRGGDESTSCSNGGEQSSPTGPLELAGKIKPRVGGGRRIQICNQIESIAPKEEHAKREGGLGREQDKELTRHHRGKGLWRGSKRIGASSCKGCRKSRFDRTTVWFDRSERRRDEKKSAA